MNMKKKKVNDKKYIEKYFWKAWSLYCFRKPLSSNKGLPKALKYLWKVLEKDNRNYDAWILRERILFDLNQYSSALHALNQAMKMDKLKSEAYLDYSDILFHQKKYTSALKWVNHAMKLAKREKLNREDYEFYYWGKADILKKLGKLTESRKVMKEGIQKTGSKILKAHLNEY